jgi:hypothetical protein
MGNGEEGVERAFRVRGFLYVDVCVCVWQQVSLHVSATHTPPH